MLHQVLIDLYGQNLAYARQMIQDIAEEASVLQPTAGLNHPRWILGHLAVTADQVTWCWTLREESVLAPGWQDLFGRGSVPVSESGRYPSLARIWDCLVERHAAIAQVVERAAPVIGEYALSSDVPEAFRRRFPTVGHALVYSMISHEQLHLGQLSTWRRMRGLPTVA